MTVGERQAAIPEFSPYQIEQITTQIVKYLNLDEKLKDTRPTVCPCCGRTDVQFIKKGIHYGRQRYQCKSCGSKFTYDAKQITAHSHQSIDAWITVIEDTLSLKTLDEISKKSMYVMKPHSICATNSLLFWKLWRNRKSS